MSDDRSATHTLCVSHEWALHVTWLMKWSIDWLPDPVRKNNCVRVCVHVCVWSYVFVTGVDCCCMNCALRKHKDHRLIGGVRFRKAQSVFTSFRIWYYDISMLIWWKKITPRETDSQNTRVLVFTVSEEEMAVGKLATIIHKREKNLNKKKINIGWWRSSRSCDTAHDSFFFFNYIVASVICQVTWHAFL